MSIVSRETNEMLENYAALIRQWNPRINLVAPSTIENLFERHINDCLQITQHADPQEGIWADIGSGGGLPGLVMAVCYRSRPVDFVLVESDQRKATFLRTVIRVLGLDSASVKTARVEQLDPLNAAYISARALAPLPRLMPYLSRHLAEDGQAWLMKGRQWQDEISQTVKEWTFTSQPFPSQTDDGAAILKITGIRHV
jgi:16S rRNA (guanine527-N7)-methyltransferase